ncbi:dephospho-CoA kinase [Polaribacter undariae]|uniref:Dephospho-CoA kinase n=1 Tax=Polaribacter sejongensis TaxID=985043 RepID=A0AAJ1QZD5_9FLAO|nr:dephospho-CoA kinase [Polaribacter undariae]MDN3620718.1 dephospho-CoA kinase [Polaribacter undariae]UWD32108.1 dephospho-CoA kinase [Polaribacter undariae]
MVVGLTGGIGSGKTTVASIFANFNTVAIYNADLEAKKLMNTSPIIKSKIIEEFGDESYLDNQLNRPFIANLVFKDKSKLAALNGIVHPEVKNHFNEFVKLHADKEYILYENAILFESKSNLKCDIIISVYAPLNIRIERTMLRDNTSKIAVENRIKNQWLEDKKLLQSNYVITNLSKENTHFQVLKIHNILTKKEVSI